MHLDILKIFHLKENVWMREFDKLDKSLKPEDSIYDNVKEVFEAYAVDEEFRKIIDSKKFAELWSSSIR